MPHSLSEQAVPHHLLSAGLMSPLTFGEMAVSYSFAVNRILGGYEIAILQFPLFQLIYFVTKNFYYNWIAL